MAASFMNPFGRRQPDQVGRGQADPLILFLGDEGKKL